MEIRAPSKEKSNVLILSLLLAATLFLAYANGANDNFKGVATLYGSGTLAYNRALALATFGQIAGSASSVLLADALVKAFSGKGLVASEISASSPFLASVGIGASATVMLATLLGFPISTTHALIGALVGAALIANMGAVDMGVLGQTFLLPLLASPLMAGITTAPLYWSASWAKTRGGFSNDTCLCVDVAPQGPSLPRPDGTLVGHREAFAPAVTVGTTEYCTSLDSYKGRILGINVQSLVDNLHYLSAFVLCFARGLNDTPKIFALLFAAGALHVHVSLVLIALAMAVGGLLHARKVAEKMSRKITNMNEGQALVANLVASFYVIAASKLGLPVSTTHVTVGAITGVGIVNGRANFAVIRDILLSWVLTLPIAAAIGASAYVLFKVLGG
jgi:inorganic phosphate transporter, PiT family